MIDKAHPTEEFLRSIDIHAILPQREPFVMVGVLTHFEMMTSTTETVIRPDNIFVENGRFTAAGMLENIAQTCAARIGYYNKYVLDNEVCIGVIGAVRDFTVECFPSVGSVITTRVDVAEEVFGMTLADALITCGGGVVAKAQVKLAVRNEKVSGN